MTTDSASATPPLEMPLTSDEVKPEESGSVEATKSDLKEESPVHHVAETMAPPPQPAGLEAEPPLQVKSHEPEPPQREMSEPELMQKVTLSEAERSKSVTTEPETPQKVMLSKPERSLRVEESQWTEPEPPDASVLEAAAAGPDPEEQEPPEPEAHNETSPAEPRTAASQPAAVESRSLAEMMDKEETEAAEEIPENPPAPTLAASEEDNKPRVFPRNLGSFKEESNKISDLTESERKSLQELRQLLNESSSSSDTAGEISVWGIPLLKDDRSDVVLLKFLRARDFKVEEAHSMLSKTIQWRKDFKIDELVDENLGDDLEKVVFMQGDDREGHPVCYNVYGEFQNRELYQKTFSDEEKRKKFLRWRIQFLEKSIRKLDFSPGGVSTIFQVNDLKNSPGPGKRELRLATKQAVHLLQDNYPEFVAKQIFINVPWWYLAFYTMISPFMTQRSKSKLVFAGPSRSAETLFKYISPERVPIQYGGLSVDHCDCNSEFTTDDSATEITIKPTTKQNVEIIIYEKCVIVWEIRVVGWEVSYGAEFIPENNEGYTVVIQKPRKMTPTDEPVVSQSFKVGELGKILLTIDNPTAKKKKLIYRFKVKPLPQ